MLILYGATAGVSVVKLYAGAFFPGIMLAGLVHALRHHHGAAQSELAPKLPRRAKRIRR